LEEESNQDYPHPENIGPIPGAIRADNPGKQGRRKKVSNQQKQDYEALMVHVWLQSIVFAYYSLFGSLVLVCVGSGR
jgi:hypothetical protein